LVFFGANDSVISGQPQHVELNEYRQNIKSIIFHDKVKPHNSKILLIAPSPICEYTTQEHNEIRGKPIIQRLASKTKEYAEAAVEVGEEIGIPVVNLWQIFIDYAGGWREGEPIPGSKSLPRNEKLCNLFIDGLHFDSKG
jgi:lysophospholipase L1-like esterase